MLVLPEDRGDDNPPGGWIYQDEYWRAGHMPHTYGPMGMVLLESQRHFLDASEMSDAEAAGHADVLGRATGAIRYSVGAQRVYMFASMADQEHMHVWLLPWTPDRPKGPAFVAAASMLACTPEQALEAAALLRNRLTPMPTVT